MEIKDILKVNLTESRRLVKSLSDKQLSNLIVKLSKLGTIASDESNKRYAAALEEEVNEELLNEDNDDSNDE